MLKNSHLSKLRLTDEHDHIIKGCMEGHRIAQEQLYRIFSPKMYGVCMRYCRNRDEANDILQDGFIKVFEKIHQFRNQGSIEGWIRRIMVNTALEFFRKKSQVLVMEQVPEINDENDDDTWDLGLSSNELLQLIQKLPDRYRMVFNLYVFEDLTHKEIAETMGISEGTSKSDLSRARALLQNKINLLTKKLAKIG